jgi:hypothetical protein
MKVLLDIKDNKAHHLMEVLKGLSYVKAMPLTPYNARVPEDVKEVVDQMNLIRPGKLQARNEEDLFDEL